MIQPGDLVTFVGSYFVEQGTDLRHVMTSIPKKGIVIEVNTALTKILSDDFFCILIEEQRKLFKIRKIQEKDSV